MIYAEQYEFSFVEDFKSGLDKLHTKVLSREPTLETWENGHLNIENETQNETIKLTKQ